jgi:hypothetical protein
MAFNWSWNGILKQAAQQGMEGYKPGTPQAPQGYVPYEATLNQRGLSNNMQPDNSVIPGTTYQPDNFGNRQPQAVTQMEAVQQAPMNTEREERIASLTSQIKELEDRIASNEAKLKGWTGPANEIAALEAEKINIADPTSIWRWKADKDESRRIAAAEKLKGIDQAQTNAMYEITNTLSAIRPNAAMDSGTQQRYFQQLADLKTLAQKNGLPTDAIDAKIREVEGGKPEGEEQTSREKAKTDWKGLKNKPGLTSAEVQAKLNDPNLNWDPDERKEAENLVIELGKKEAADQDVKDMKAWAKKTFGDEWDTLDPRVQAAYKRMWKAQKGKK